MPYTKLSRRTKPEESKCIFNLTSYWPDWKKTNKKNNNDSKGIKKHCNKIFPPFFSLLVISHIHTHVQGPYRGRVTSGKIIQVFIRSHVKQNTLS